MSHRLTNRNITSSSRGPAQECARRRRLKKYGHTCEECGFQGYVELHHIKAIADGGTHADENTILLCDDCHRKAHGWKPRRPGVAEWATRPVMGARDATV